MQERNAKKLIVPHHGAWRYRPTCRAMQNGTAWSDAGPAHPTWQLYRTITKGAADTYAAPCSMALKKGLLQWNSFAEGLFLKFIWNLGFFIQIAEGRGVTKLKEIGKINPSLLYFLCSFPPVCTCKVNYAHVRTWVHVLSYNPFLSLSFQWYAKNFGQQWCIF
jgi:hypothetical protein